MTPAAPSRPRVVVAVGPRSGDDAGSQLLARARRWSGEDGDLLVLHVVPPRRSPAWPDGEAGRDDVRREVEAAGGSYHEVTAEDVAVAVAQFVKAVSATHLVLGRPSAGRPRRRRAGMRVVDAVAALSPGTDVVLVATARRSRRRPWPRRGPVAGPLGPLRLAAGWLLALAGPPAVTAVLLPWRDDLDLSTDVIAVTVVAVAVALVGGLWPAVVAAVAGGLLLNWYFTPPYGTLAVAQAEHWLALIAFVLVTAAVATVVDGAARRASVARRWAREAETATVLAREVLGGDGTLPDLLARLAATFDVPAVALVERRSGPGAWATLASSGPQPPRSPGDGQETVWVGPGRLLVLRGRRLRPDDRRVLEVFAAHVAALLGREELESQARRAADLAHGNAVRAALLSAVSHDLRTPLASIKAAVSSLRQPDVTFTAEDTAELLGTVEDGADKLQRLVDNLLDVSRLQAGVVQPVLRPVGLWEVAPQAVDGVPAGRVRLDLDETLPLLHTDPALLERVLANLVENAVRHGGTTHPVVLTAAAPEAGAGRMRVCVVDRGRGVPVEQRRRMFEAFQRVGDAPARGAGVGLGLAVARGLTEALGGTLEAENTPGGGLTMVVTLPVATP
ncbi:MAG: DUF4118 domain-containing protein [Kineosporiaceae bacterium]